MRIKRVCKVCGNVFLAIKTTQFFCSRKCFKKDYYLRIKAKVQEKEQNPHYPSRICGFCGEKSVLNFDPIKEQAKFDDWHCPFCGVTNKTLWQNIDNPMSQQEIAEFISTYRENNPVNEVVEYVTYNIPIRRIGDYEPPVVLLTCTEMKITDIQRGGRKKIIFS